VYINKPLLFKQSKSFAYVLARLVLRRVALFRRRFSSQPPQSILFFTLIIFSLWHFIQTSFSRLQFKHIALSSSLRVLTALVLPHFEQISWFSMFLYLSRWKQLLQIAFSFFRRIATCPGFPHKIHTSLLQLAQMSIPNRVLCQTRLFF